MSISPEIKKIPFYTETNDSVEAVNDLMRHVANLLPDKLRGPFGEEIKS